MSWKTEWLDRLVGAGEARSEAGRALLEERYRALSRQIPLLYAIGLANIAGLYLATKGAFGSFYNPITPLVLLLIVRLVHWLRARREMLAPERILIELRKTFFYALAFCVGFCGWALYQLSEDNPANHDLVILFGSLAAVGCAYGVSAYLAAARLPILLLGLPLATRLIFSPDPGHIGMGVSLSLILLLILHLLRIHDEGFSRLIESRTGIAAERERARRAERVAKVEKAKAKRTADTDPLTGLANRRAFLRHLARRAAALSRSGDGLALAILDLDGFKPINDTFGHATGDAVLEEVGARLTSVGGRSALAARIGGDEFALLFPRIRTVSGAKAIGAAVRSALEEPFVISGREFRISGCCGLTLLRVGDCDPAQALIRADSALYQAKHSGRAGIAVFSEEMDALNLRRVQIEDSLRLKASQDAIGLVFQPIRDLATGELRAFEALARWNHDLLGPVAPGEFIPIAEQINLIGELSERLLRDAVGEARRWAGSVRLSFNVSAVQLCVAGSADRLLTILAEAGLDPGRLQFEVTETALLVDFETARTNLQQFRAAGTRIVLDDFGAGHASISYLREMQFDGIKLDGSLIASPHDSMRSRRLLKGVLDLCAAMGLPCVAEHIETREQLELLRKLGCRDGQGYLLSPPVDAQAAAAMAGPRLTLLRAGSAAG
ncbi:MAG: diguanylate cyclase protein [Alphaproteobacteria bacterium]|nr:diguanylate cyclase protein [Alphaproteobacteria bacterium]